MSTPSEPLPRPAAQTVSRRQIRFVDAIGIFLAALGLVALIELHPRLSGAQQPPFKEADKIPAFTLTNDGYLKVTKLHATCWFLSMNITGNNVFRDVGFGGLASIEELAPGDNFTFQCGGNGTNVNAPASMIQNVDAVVVAWYRPWPLTFLRTRKFFRFSGVNTGTKIEWYKQAPGDAEERYDQVAAKLRMRPPTD